MTTVRMNLSEQSIENIEKIEKLSGVSNKTTAVATALEIASVILKHQEKGDKVYIEDGDYRRQLKFE